MTELSFAGVSKAYSRENLELMTKPAKRLNRHILLHFQSILYARFMTKGLRAQDGFIARPHVMI